MPLLDPVVQLALINIIEDKRYVPNESKMVFISNLKKAEYNLKRNFDTIKNSIQFKKDLENNINLIKKHFECNDSIEKDFKDPSINNFYTFLIDHIGSKIMEEYQNNDVFHGYFLYYKKYDFKLYMPEIEFNSIHRWFFSDTSIAVLSILLSSKNTKDKSLNEIISYLNIEVDLMIASGYSIALTIYWDQSSLEFDKITNLINLLKNHNFAEVHFNLANKKSEKVSDLENFLSLFNDYLNEVNYFVYFYSSFIQQYSNKISEILKKMKQVPYLQIIMFSLPIQNAIYTNNVFKSDAKCITTYNGFSNRILQVFLSNIPLYDSDDVNDLIPSNNSGICFCYVLPKDFLYFNNSRVKILINNNEYNNRYYSKYVNFEDLHLIRPDLYVNDKLSLTRSDYSTLQNVYEIISKTNEKIEEKPEFSKESIFTFFKNNKIPKALIYVSYAYTDYMRIHTNNNNFNLHKNQVFTAYEACKICLANLNKKESNQNKGVIYQVETGEGKSCIVCLIASLLALLKKTVHIASSNITLAKRDYIESIEFFKKLGLRSAVLLHYNEHPIHDKSYDQIFPKEFFGKKLFKNSSNMNFSVCGITDNNEITKDKADIVFSTFVNFENLYLRMMELCPGYIETYFKNCSLVIDEADSILIDELTNGTILSRSMKTNGNEILKLIYQRYMENKNEDEVLIEVRKQFPKCIDLDINDIKEMFQQIKLVQQEEFVDGKKYSIETYKVKEVESVIQNVKEIIMNPKKKIKKGIKKIFTKKDKLGKKEDDSQIVKNEYKKETKTFKKIVPFDYDHKGVLEPNKEFSGFVQQFIAIKEIFNNSENSNMTIKDVSMNYLYVSHPIFVSLYSGVCGLTGTIGNKYDKKLLKEQYDLDTKKIPRDKSNLRVEYPILLSKDINERNSRIVSEVITLSNKGFPVLVIFQDLNEIYEIYHLLNLKGIKFINIFNGKNDKIKPDNIAGIKRSISLGTNVCGRGTDIKNPQKPLHVIVTYFSSNSRVMYQAFGRTARQGNEGSVRIICLENQFVSPVSIFNEIEMKNILSDFQLKNKIQRSFIEKFRINRKWIFSSDIKSQNFSDEQIESMRKCKINVNRLRVFNYEFPICLKISTFLLIQAQKIFSLYNCPNCKYTWMLFQKYVREMILESWSLFIEKTDKQYSTSNTKIKYNDFLENECKKLYSLLSMYLPDSNKVENYEIIPTFMHIFNLVRDKFEDEILNSFPKELTNCFNQYGKKRFCTFTFGFKPFSLVDKSGIKINTMNGDEQKQTYIEDPELKYEKQYPHHCFSPLSITEKIDGIFNMICQKINDNIGSYIGLNFFLRRTLGGCEFGVCFDFELENIDDKIMKDQICIVDKDPLLIFTVYVKSIVPLLAGILIIGLVYIASIAKTIFEWITNFLGKGIIEIVKITVKEVVKRLTASQVEKLCNTICSFLNKVIAHQIVKMKESKPEIAKIFLIILKLAIKKDFSQSGEMINNLFGNNLKFNMKFDFAESLIDDVNPLKYFLKIGLLLMLCFASFMINFYYHNQSITYDSEKVSKEFDDEQNTEKIFQQNKDVVDVEVNFENINTS